MGSLNPVSSELIQMRELLIDETHVDGALHLDAAKAGLIIERLNKIASIAKNIEDELGIHRVQKSEQATAAVLDDMAMGFLQEAVDNNVVTPDFGANRKSQKNGGAV